MPEIEEYEHLYGRNYYYAWLPIQRIWMNGRYQVHGGIAHLMKDGMPQCNTKVHTYRYVIRPELDNDVRVCKLCERKLKAKK